VCCLVVPMVWVLSWRLWFVGTCWLIAMVKCSLSGLSVLGLAHDMDFQSAGTCFCLGVLRRFCGLFQFGLPTWTVVRWFHGFVILSAVCLAVLLVRVLIEA